MTGGGPATVLPDLSPWLRAGDTVLCGQADAQPRRLTRALVEQRHKFAPLRLFLGIGQAPQLRPEHADALGFLAYGAAGTNRALAQAGVLDILPCHYSQLPALIRDGTLKVDVAMLRVPPPDGHGRYSLGLANDYLCAAVERARVLVGEVDPAVPWTHGELTLTRDDFDLLVDADAADRMAAATAPAGAPGPVEQAIARHVAALVEDASTLQVGIGRLPDALLSALSGHRDLGFHSGAAGDGWMDLVKKGVITNTRKPVDRGISVIGVLVGSPDLYAFAHLHDGLRLRSADYTHSPRVLASIPRLVALNSAIEVDLYGQVNTEWAGGRYVGALGGSADFLRGAHASEGGLPVIALASQAGGRSNIVARVSGPASLSAGDAGVIVTEYGVADLRGQPVSERHRRLIAIAHPDHRETLEKQTHGTLF